MRRVVSLGGDRSPAPTGKLHPLSYLEYAKACMHGGVAPQVLAYYDQSEYSQAIAGFAHLIGALEPLSGFRPSIRTIVSTVDEEQAVQPAASATLFRKKKIYEICGPMGFSIMVKRLRITPANLTATDDGEVAYLRYTIVNFRDMCVAYDASSDRGKLVSKENIALCPSAGFEVHAINRNPNSIARFHVESEVWAL